MAKLRINGDSSGYVDLEAPNAASSSTLDLDQVPQKNATTTGFTGNMGIGTNSPLSSPAGAFAWANPIATIEGSRPTLYLNGSGSLATIRMWPSGTDGSSTTLDDFHINAIATSGSTPGSLTFAAQGGAIGAGLSINSNNIVTTPDQPVFAAYSPAKTSQNNYVVFGNTYTNVGGHYNTSNGRFTAPVAGTYFFNYNILMGDPYTGSYVRVLFRVNGASTGQTLGDTLSDASATDYTSVHNTAVFTMSAGDYIQVYNEGPISTYGTNYGNFGGYLIG